MVDLSSQLNGITDETELKILLLKTENSEEKILINEHITKTQASQNESSTEIIKSSDESEKLEQQNNDTEITIKENIQNNSENDEVTKETDKVEKVEKDEVTKETDIVEFTNKVEKVEKDEVTKELIDLKKEKTQDSKNKDPIIVTENEKKAIEAKIEEKSEGEKKEITDLKQTTPVQASNTSNTQNTQSVTKSPFTMFQNKGQSTAGTPNVGRPKPVGPQTEAAKVKETILNWCIARTEGYPNVNVTNFSSSWNNGMAFCALIHHHCPETFDFNKLDPRNRKGNFELAFKVAEDKCDIPPLLEANDMVLMGNKPDARCVFTYLSTMYQKLELMPKAKKAAAAKKNEV